MRVNNTRNSLPFHCASLFSCLSLRLACFRNGYFAGAPPPLRRFEIALRPRKATLQKLQTSARANGPHMANENVPRKHKTYVPAERLRAVPSVGHRSPSNYRWEERLNDVGIGEGAHNFSETQGGELVLCTYSTGTCCAVLRFEGTEWLDGSVSLCAIVPAASKWLSTVSFIAGLTWRVRVCLAL